MPLANNTMGPIYLGQALRELSPALGRKKMEDGAVNFDPSVLFNSGMGIVSEHCRE